MSTEYTKSFVRMVQQHIALRGLKTVGEKSIETAFNELDANRQKTKENPTGTPMVNDIYKRALALESAPPAQGDADED